MVERSASVIATPTTATAPTTEMLRSVAYAASPPSRAGPLDVAPGVSGRKTGRDRGAQDNGRERGDDDCDREKLGDPHHAAPRLEEQQVGQRATRPLGADERRADEEREQAEDQRQGKERALEHGSRGEHLPVDVVRGLSHGIGALEVRSSAVAPGVLLTQRDVAIDLLLRSGDVSAADRPAVPGHTAGDQSCEDQTRDEQDDDRPP
jgi:hypothetical protein